MITSSWKHQLTFWCSFLILSMLWCFSDRFVHGYAIALCLFSFFHSPSFSILSIKDWQCGLIHTFKILHFLCICDFTSKFCCVSGRLLFCPCARLILIQSPFFKTPSSCFLSFSLSRFYSNNKGLNFPLSVRQVDKRNHILQLCVFQVSILDTHTHSLFLSHTQTHTHSVLL